VPQEAKQKFVLDGNGAEQKDLFEEEKKSLRAAT